MDLRQNKQEEEELNKIYPPGSPAREILDYSRAKHPHQAVPPMLMIAFKILMGISIAAGAVGFIAVLIYG